MMRRLVPTFFALASLAAPIAGQAPAPAEKHPDFAGTWVMDPTRSVGSNAPGLTFKVRTDSGKLTYTRIPITTPRTPTSTLRVMFDGQPTKNTFAFKPDPLEMTLVGKWEGSSFLVKTATKIGDKKSDQIDRWALAADGKTLYFESRSLAGDVAKTARLVFTKKE